MSRKQKKRLGTVITVIAVILIVLVMDIGLITNFLTAEKYGGKCNLRFDDTNPAKEDMEYVRAIEKDIHWLGFHWTG